MEIFIGSDYKGFDRKNAVLGMLASTDYTVNDVGPYECQEGDDFNDAAVKVALEVRNNLGSRGILICDSAHGMTMQANRFKGIRAAHCDSVESARLAREHDDANILCLSAHFLDEEKTRDIVFAFLETDFSGLERRVRRINRLDEREDYD